MKLNKNKIWGLGIIGFITALVMWAGVASSTIINQGHVGVVFSLTDGVQDITLDEGHNWIVPWHSVTKFPVSTETVPVPTFNVITRDGKPLEMTMSYDFAVNSEMVSDVFVKFRGQSIGAIQDSWLRDRAQRATLSVFARYSVMDVFQNLPRIQHDVFEEMQAITEEYGFNIQSVTLQAPQMDVATAKAIQEVVNAQQQLERMEIELQQAEVLAETAIEEARGRAEALLLEAEAQSEANDLLQRSLSDELIASQWIEAWNGKLPVVGDSGNVILDINSLFGE